MKTSLALVAFALGLAACGAAGQRTSPPPASALCLTGGLVPASQSMQDYGTTYTPDLEGPAPAVPPQHVANCDDLYERPGWYEP
jgi:hypothetical protein